MLNGLRWLGWLRLTYRYAVDGASEVRVGWLIEWSQDWFIVTRPSGLEVFPKKEVIATWGGEKLAEVRCIFTYASSFSSVSLSPANVSASPPSSSPAPPMLALLHSQGQEKEKAARGGLR